MRDLHNNLKVLDNTCVTITDNTAQVCTADRKGFEAVEFFVNLGTIADADTTITLLVEDSDDNSTWAAVSDDFLLGVEAAGLQYDSDNLVGKIGYNGGKRYVRVTATPANNTGSLPIALLAVGGFGISAKQTTQVV